MAAPTIDNVTSGSIVNDNAVEPATVAIPTGDGDLLLALVATGTGSAIRICNTPTGWTLLDQELALLPNRQVFYLADAAEVTGTVDFTPAATYTSISAVVLRISGSDYTTLVADFIDENGTGGSADVNCPSVTVPADDSLLFRAAAYGVVSSLSFSLSGYTETFDSNFSGAGLAQAVYSKAADSGASGTAVITSSINWSDRYVGTTLAVGPAISSQSPVPVIYQQIAG